VKNEKEQTEGNNCSFCEKESFFLNARENFRTLCAFCLLFRERERERKRKTKKTRFTPAKSVLCFVVLPRFLPLDFFEYLFLKREEEEQSLGEERNSST
jgi:hypothetical protein